jgi:hypothetical protein
MKSSQIYLKIVTDINTVMFMTFFGISFSLSIYLLVYDSIDVREFFLEAVIFGSIAFFIFFFRRGYRLSFDDQAVYRRPIGLTWSLHYKPEVAMRYDEIAKMVGAWGDNGFRESGAGLFMPFRYIRLYRKNWDGEEFFELDTIFTIHEELQMLVRHILKMRPDLATEIITNYLESSRRI